jgi:(p)ppGpp synthase/HD superfamily hydrolase
VPQLGSRFSEALAYAAEVHRGQVRKGTAVPYLAHLLGVAAMVLEAGGDEDEAIAALLHDTVEDQGGAARLADVRDRFGDHVAAVVAACSDTDQQPKPPWRERKEAFLEHLQKAPPDVLRVSLADKLYNARALVADLRAQGDRTWPRFNAGKLDQLWYYRTLAELFRARLPGAMADQLGENVAEMERLSS